MKEQLTYMENKLFGYYSIKSSWGENNEKNTTECSNYSTIALISHTSKVMLKILQARFQVHEPWTSRCSDWI